MKSFFIKILLLPIAHVCFGQNYEQCPEGENSCGPMSEINKRTKVINSSLQQLPYSYIVHQEIIRGSENYSTGSFIAYNMIITAHHNVFQSFRIRKLSFCNKSVDKDKWVRFRRREVKIYHFKRVKAPTDISIIVFKNPEKIKELFKGSFKINNYQNLKAETVHLTGFPCDLPDTLVDKTIDFASLKTKKDKTLIGYYMYTCTGDSGAPLWMGNSNQPTIIGIHHGAGDAFFGNDYNCSAEITDSVIKWVNKLLKKYP